MDAFLSGGTAPMDITLTLHQLLLMMGIPSAFTGFCFWLLERKIQKREEQDRKEREHRQAEVDRRDTARREYERYQISMISASMALSVAVAEAVQRIPDAHCNGDMHAALEYAKKIKGEQKDFLNKMAIENIDF